MNWGSELSVTWLRVFSFCEPSSCVRLCLLFLLFWLLVVVTTADAVYTYIWYFVRNNSVCVSLSLSLSLSHSGSAAPFRPYSLARRLVWSQWCADHVARNLFFYHFFFIRHKILHYCILLCARHRLRLLFFLPKQNSYDLLSIDDDQIKINDATHSKPNIRGFFYSLTTRR